MDVATVLSAVQTLFSALQCSELKEVLSIFGYESQLDDLQRTIKTITAALSDAEAKQELSREAQNWIEELKDVVFEADDLFDEFVTLAEQKKLLKANGSLSKKVSSFFSPSKNSISLACKMSRGIKDIKKKLDAIVYNTQFRFKLDSEPIRQRRQETCSYVNEVDVIGRKDDLENIVGMLLDSNVQRDVSFLSIVGIGGLGKTALAQLVYNDPRVTSAFPLRKWACVSDQDQKQLDVKEILLKMLVKNPDGFTMDKILLKMVKNPDSFTMDEVQIKLREQLADKKYLLVLDDVWTEKRDQWHALANHLIGGQRGSWVVVTTRSEETSRIIGDGVVYKLQGLSDKNSWLLFHKTAFGREQLDPPNDLVTIGQEIVGKCARVPLAIRVVGSLLYGQGKNKWLSFRNVGLANIRESQNDIMPILKLSYHHLESPLKSCLAFCALFPKDFVMKKKMLMSIWMAQGYIVPLDKGQSIEDAGEEYFLILTRRCFLQDVREEWNGDISCKIHDLMHDIAQKVSGKEICSTNSFCGNLDKKVRHLYLTGIKGGKYSFHKRRIRSIFLYGTCVNEFNMDQIMAKESLANCMWLRALHLSWSNIKSLPESIGQLLHLRYLDLSGNNMELLPKSITKLYNLETLVLEGCFYLKELPKDLHRLVKLRELNIMFCSQLKFMPRGMGKLSCLNSLSNVIVGGEGSYVNWKQWFYALDDLKALDKLKGRLNIEIILPKDAKKFVKEDGVTKGLYLRSKERLNAIVFDFKHEEAGGRVDDEGIIKLMEELQPHLNLKRLVLLKYHCVKLPSWVAHLTNLVRLCIRNCGELEYLSPLGYLHHLKELRLADLSELEYIFEDCSHANSSFMPNLSTLGVVELEFFPALESLWLSYMPMLKGWRRGRGFVDDNNSNKAQLQLVRFYQLKSLEIRHCSQLTSIMMCPRVEEVQLNGFNENLQIIINSEREERLGELPPSSSRIDIVGPYLKDLKVDNFVWLNSLPIEAFHHLEELTIYDDEKVESLREAEKVFRGCSSSLRCLTIADCSKLKNVVCGGLEHLVALEHLNIAICPELRRLEEEQERGDGIGIGILPWKFLHHSLHSLKLYNLPQLEKLPDGMQYLTNLQVLYLRPLRSMKSMPEWMPKLTSLRTINLQGCSESLKQRCQKDPPGEDWPYIQHIPNILYTYSY